VRVHACVGGKVRVCVRDEERAWINGAKQESDKKDWV